MARARESVRMAMVGGGPGSFIGPVHRMAAELTGRIRLVAGAFSSDPAKSRDAGLSYGVENGRAYASYEEMCAQERQRPDPVHFVAVVTPNHLHLPVARVALESGFHVLSDKPATATLAESQALRKIVETTGHLYGLTYTYTGYGLVREARDTCRRGKLGNIRKVVAEYSQGWLTERLELDGVKQAEWRSDPARVGAGGCIGDIGVHAFNLVEFVTGQRIAQVNAGLSTVVDGRLLDDDCNALLRLDNGAPGVLFTSQVATGERNGLRLRVYGEKGGLDWSQEDPNRLTLNWLDGSSRTLHGAANSACLSRPARAAFRLPLGHPEGFIEALANIYNDFTDAVLAREAGRPADLETTAVPTIADGVRGMAFVEAALESSRTGAGWAAIT